MTMTQVYVDLRHLHPAQQQIVEEARRWNVLMCGRRFGKTSLGGDLAINPALDGLSVGWFAPTYKLLEEAWREMRSMLAPIPGLRANAQQMRLELPTGGVIECWSLEGGEDVARGRKYHRVIVDEAGLVDNLLRIFHAAIRPTLADYAGDAWFLGTPKGIGDFSELYDWGQDVEKSEWASWRKTTQDNPHIPASEIEAMRREMPDAIYRQEVLGEPIDDAEHPIGLLAIKACIVPEISTKPAVIYGLDLGRAVDPTVLIGLDEFGTVCHLERFQAPWNVTRGRVKAIIGAATNKKAVWTRADSTGVGDPIVEDLQRDGCAVESFVFTARSKQAAVETLITSIQQKWIRYPEGFIPAELRTLQCERTQMGIRYQALEGRHDDCVMALALAVEGWRDMGFKQIVDKAPYYQDKSTLDWKTGRAPKTLPIEPVARTNKRPWKHPPRSTQIDTRKSYTESL